MMFVNYKQTPKTLIKSCRWGSRLNSQVPAHHATVHRVHGSRYHGFNRPHAHRTCDRVTLTARLWRVSCAARGAARCQRFSSHSVVPLEVNHRHASPRHASSAQRNGSDGWASASGEMHGPVWTSALHTEMVRCVVSAIRSERGNDPPYSPGLHGPWAWPMPHSPSSLCMDLIVEATRSPIMPPRAQHGLVRSQD